jgi:hypothetical protein
MPLYNFNDKQQFISIDNIPDFRSDEEKVNSPLSIYNHDSNDLAYAERLAEESINISGAWVQVYKLGVNSGKDDVWEEDADPKYERGIKLKGFFAPKPVETQLTKFGIDIENHTTIWFSRAVVFKTFGSKMISEGDVIVVPHNTMAIVQSDVRAGVGTRMDRYRVLNSADEGNFKYRWLYWTCILENLTGDIDLDVQFARENS